MNPIFQLKIRTSLCLTSVAALIGIPMSGAGLRAVAESNSLVKAVVAGSDADGDGVPDAQDNCPTIPNPEQENTDLALNESFECGEFSGWGFTYSSNGQQSGSHANGAGNWSSMIVTTPLALSGTFSARLYADSPMHGGVTGPWDAKAAIHTTITTVTAPQILQGTVQFDQIQGSGGAGGSWFQISVINASDPSKLVSYGYNTTGDAPGDVKTTVSVAESISFNLNVTEDYFNKYTEGLPDDVIIRFRAFADYGEGGSGPRTTEVRLDNIRVSAPDSLGDVCDYCAPVFNPTPDPDVCLNAIAQALDLPGTQGCGVSFTGDDRSLAVMPRFGNIEPSMGEDFVVMCTGDVLQSLAQPGTDLPMLGTDRATLTLTLQTPPGVCETGGEPDTLCRTNADCSGDCAKSEKYWVRFCYYLLTAEYPESTGSLGDAFGDTFEVTLTDSNGTTPLVEFSPNSPSPLNPRITPAPDSLVSGTQFDIPLVIPPAEVDDCLLEAGFVRQCVNIDISNLSTDATVDLVFMIEETVNQKLDSCVILDAFQLTSFEVVDPNPDLLDGDGKIKTAREDIKEGGRDVGGAAADGVTRVLLREEVALPYGKVEFCLNSGTAPQDGGLSQVGRTERDQCVLACVKATGTAPNQRYFAFAVYWTPPEFNRGGTHEADDLESGERQVDFRATWYPLCTCAGPPFVVCEPILRILRLESRVPFKLVRPPLLLIHGVWSDAGTWNDFPLYQDSQKRERYSVQRADYEKTNAVHLKQNNTVVPEHIKETVKKLRKKQPCLAVTQVDIGAHSMGGLLSRAFIANTKIQVPKYKYKENFFAGDIHKLVTFDTPHLGFPAANFFVALGKLPCYGGCVTVLGVETCVEICVGQFVRDIFRLLDKPIDRGAIEDMRGCSGQLQQIEATDVPGHACIGRLVPEIDWMGELALIENVCEFVQFFCRAIDLINDFCDPFGPDLPPAVSVVLSIFPRLFSRTAPWCAAISQIGSSNS